MPSLDERLGAARARLLDEIDQPDLAAVTARAAVLRRRRRAGRAGAALLALVAVGALVTRPWPDRGAPVAPATSPTPTPTSANIYLDLGLTVNGLVTGQRITELPGDVRDVEFVDPDRGWVLAGECPKGAGTCRLTLAGTEDGGLTWRVAPISTGPTGGDPPDLVTLGPDTLVLHWPAGPSSLSTDGGATWRAAPAASGPAPTTIGVHDRLLLRRGGSGCAGSVVELWQAGRGNAGPVASPPPLDVCWVGTVRSAEGGWWVGGTLPGGRAAAAVSYDGGARWQRYEFDGEAGSARVATLGAQAYAAVVDATGALRGIYHSTGRGSQFARTWRGGGEPYTLGGELVPLLDGRLLVTDGTDRWFVSATGGQSFTRAAGLPSRVGRLARTQAGYVVYNVVADGWTAFSADGATWRKLHVH